MSSANGEVILDAYIEACEKGGRTIGDLLSDLFDASGYFRSDIFEFREDPDNPGMLQFRVGDFFSPGGGWITLSYTDFSTFIAACDAQRVLAEAAATNAAASAASASASATSATGSKNAAATSATNAATSESNAAASASSASTSAATATTQASNAGASATAAATSASNAAASATAAANAAASSLPLAGGTVTGALNLIGSGNLALRSSTADPQVLFQRQAGSISGVLRFENTNNVVRLDARDASGTIQSALTLGSNAPSIKYNGNDVWHTGNLTPANYLPLAGGTMTGNLNLAPDIDMYLTTQTSNGGVIGWKRGADATLAALFWYSVTQGAMLTQTYNSAGTLINTLSLSDTTAGSFSLNGNTIWHAGNFTPSDYLPLAGGTVTGALNLVGQGYATIQSAASDPTMVLKSQAGAIRGVVRYEHTADFLRIDARDAGGVIRSALTLGSTSASFKYNGNDVWHAGNFTPSDYLPLTGGSLSGTLVADIGVYAKGITGTNPRFELRDTASVRRFMIASVMANSSASIQNFNTSATLLNTLSFPAAAGGDLLWNGGTVVDTGNMATTLAAYAKLASPALSGTPTAPTQAAGNNSTRIATTAFVTTAVAALQSSLNFATGYSTDVSGLGIGAVAILGLSPINTAITAGNSYAGSTLRVANLAAGSSAIVGGFTATTLTGTWKALQNVPANANGMSLGNFVRTA